MDLSQLEPNLFLKRSGQLKLHSDILRNLAKEVCRLTRSTNSDEAFYKIKLRSRTRIRTNQTYYPEVFSVPKLVVKHWARSLSLISVPGLYSDLDLEKGKYEGGFKVWESTHDLIKFITLDQSIMNELLHRGEKFKALELGAGASLPSLALLSRLIGDPTFQSEYRIHVQDYNWQVLISLTLSNFSANLPLDYLKALMDTKCLRLYYGDWKDFRRQSAYKYDLIMMSEVLYNSDNYESLHNLLDRHLRSDGYIVIATKDTYFGLTGGLYSWLDYCNNRNLFSVCKIIKNLATIPRSILILKRSPTN